MFLSVNARGLMSGILQQGYSLGYVLAACANLGVGGATDSWKTVFWAKAIPRSHKGRQEVQERWGILERNEADARPGVEDVRVCHYSHDLGKLPFIFQIQGLNGRQKE